MSFGLGSGGSSKNRSRTLNATGFPAHLLGGMMSAFGPTPNPFDAISKGRSQSSLFGSSGFGPGGGGYGDAGKMNFGFNFGVAPQALLQQSYPEMNVRAGWNPYQPINFSGNQRSGGGTGGTGGGGSAGGFGNMTQWGMNQDAYRAYANQSAVGLSWNPQIGWQRSNQNPELVWVGGDGANWQSGQYYLFGHPVSYDQVDWLNTGTPNTDSHNPQIPQAMTWLKSNTTGNWGNYPPQVWNAYAAGHVSGLSWNGNQWDSKGNDADLVYYGPTDQLWFRGWEITKEQEAALKENPDAWYAFFASAENALTNNNPQQNNIWNNPQSQQENQALAQQKLQGGTVQTPQNTAGGGRIPDNEYRVNIGDIVDAVRQFDPDKMQDWWRIFGEEGWFDASARNELTLQSIYDAFRSADGNTLSGRSKGVLMAVLGHLEQVKRIHELQEPFSAFDTADPLGDLISPFPGTGFSKDVPIDVRQAYAEGYASGWTWDGSAWTETQGNPEVVAAGDGSIWYRGQGISQEQWNKMREVGPEGLKMPTQALTDALTAGTATGARWANGQWHGDQLNPDLIYDGTNDTFWFQGNIITHDQARDFITRGPIAGGTGLIAEDMLGNLIGGAGPEGRISDEDLEAFKSGVQVGDINLNPFRFDSRVQVDPAQAQAARMDLGPGFLQDAIYNELTARPTEEYERRRELTQKQIDSQLAAKGLADSGTGMYAFRDLIEPLDRQQAALERESQATAVRMAKDYELQVATANHRAQQETNLANAGFTQEARVQTARNFLTGNLTEYETGARVALATQDQQVRAQMANMSQYAQALGLNVQSVFRERDSFMNVLGLLQNDIQMKSNAEQAFLALAFQEFAALRAATVNAGQFSTSIARASADGGWNFNIGYPGTGG